MVFHRVYIITGAITEKPNSVDKIRVGVMVSRGAGIPQRELRVQPRFPGSSFRQAWAARDHYSPSPHELFPVQRM